MAHSILEITPTVTSRIDFTNKTNAEVAQILEWFLIGWPEAMPEGLTVAQQNNWKLHQAHRKIIQMVTAEAKSNRFFQRNQSERTALEQQVEDEVRLT